jgi:hypothetical protein
MTEHRHIWAGLALGLALMLPLGAALTIGMIVVDQMHLGRLEIIPLKKDLTK